MDSPLYDGRLAGGIKHREVSIDSAIGFSSDIFSPRGASGHSGVGEPNITAPNFTSRSKPVRLIAGLADG